MHAGLYIRSLVSMKSSLSVQRAPICLGPYTPAYPAYPDTTSLFYTIQVSFTFMHLADAFIQSDLQCIHAIHIFVITCVSWESNPQPFTLLTQCSNHWVPVSLSHRNFGSCFTWESPSNHLMFRRIKLINNKSLGRIFIEAAVDFNRKFHFNR